MPGMTGLRIIMMSPWSMRRAGGWRGRGLSEGVAGIARFHELIADHLPESDGPGQVVIGIETDRGPWVTALVACGYQVYTINPRSVSRYRERHSTSGAKSDPGMRGCWRTWCAP